MRPVYFGASGISASATVCPESAMWRIMSARATVTTLTSGLPCETFFFSSLPPPM